LKKRETTPLARFDFAQSVPNGFTCSADGRYLYGSSYLTGVSNIFRYELAGGKLEAVSNTDSGFFRPVPLTGDDLLVFRYTGSGFIPTRIAATPVADISPITFLGERLSADHPVVRSWNVGSPMVIPYDTLDKHQQPYRLFGGLRLESFYPIVQGYKQSAAAGMRLNLSDRIRLNRASVAASFSPLTDLPVSERLHLEADYERYDWRGHVAFNAADFYDLVGPTKTGRKGYVVGVGRSTTVLYDEPRRLTLVVDGSVSGNLDQLPDFQNVPVRVDRLATVDAELNFSDVRKSLGAVDAESGTLWTAAAQGSLPDRAMFSHVRGSFDRGVALPIDHMSIWFRQAGGFSPNDRRQPFANFFFGGFGNNYLDRGNEKRYRDTYSLPGAKLNEIGGRNFVKSMVELNLPPLRFKGLGTPGFYVPWMRPAMFVGGLVTNLDDRASRRVVYNSGAQLDFSISALSVLDLMVSLGGAIAVEDRHAPRYEAMISLKVLR
jgi:hypothetical protein